MSDANENIPTDDDIENIGPRDFFNIGKCIGLIGKDIDIRKYKKNMDHLDHLFKKKIDAEVNDVQNAIIEFKNAIISSQKKLKAEHNEFIKDMVLSVKNANKLLSQQTNHHSIVDKHITELLGLISQRANAAHETSKNVRDGIENTLSDFNEKYDAFFKAVEQKQSLYLEELKKLDLEFRDLERGFIMGKALRTGGR